MTTDERKILRELRSKNANEVAWNILEDRRKKELEKVLSETDNLTEQEQLYLDCQNHNRNHILNIRFNDAEWKHIENQSQALGMKKSAYVRDCVMAHEKVIFDRDETADLLRQIKGISTNINQLVYRVNRTNNFYREDMLEVKEKVSEIWQLLTYIQSGLQQVKQLDTFLTQTRPGMVSMLNLLCARESQTEQQGSSKNSERISELEEVQQKHST